MDNATQRTKHRFLWLLAPITVAIGVAAVAFHLHRSTADTFAKQTRAFEQQTFMLEAGGTFSRGYSTFMAGVARRDPTTMTRASYQLDSALSHLRDGIRHNELHAVIADNSNATQLSREIELLYADLLHLLPLVEQRQDIDPERMAALEVRSRDIYRDCRAIAVEYEVIILTLNAELERRGSNASLFLTVLTIVLTALTATLATYVRLQRRTQRFLAVARHDAEHANQAKSEFLANMSHEIRTPMTAILGFAENLSDVGISVSERERCVQTIQRNGDYLLKIINDILDLSKIEAGKMTVESHPSALCEVLNDVVELVQVRAEAKGLKFEVIFEGAVPETIATDSTRLRQILVNLVANAVKFTELGKITLTFRLQQAKNGSFLEFDVTDTGIGMTSQQVGRLFRPFTQADNSMTRRYGGTGLGLTISKRFAKLLGGDLGVVKAAPGAGTTFRARISIGSTAGARLLAKPKLARKQAPPKKKCGSPTALYGRHILLAEDGPDNQVLITHVLKQVGAQVTVVADGQQAVDAVVSAKRPFDVVLMDMQMPILDGYEATQLLRQHDYKRPIIALTAHAMAGDRQKCLRAGCDGYATKPIERAKLVELILLHLDQLTIA
ncbi:MAG: response regulator [Planctomycetota bacterium]